MKSKNQREGLLPFWVLAKRLLAPIFIFCFFLLFLLSKDELITKFIGHASSVLVAFVTYGSQIGLWLSAAFLVQRVITIFFWDGLIAGISGRPVPRLPKDVTGMLLFAIATMGVLATVFDQSVTGIWATSGVLGIVVGIALRNVILDIFIGLSMHVEQPFRIGDWVMIHQNRRETHIIGQVIEVNWRTTRLKTTEKNMIVVPNSKMGEAILTNYMKPKPYFRIDLEFILDYSVPPNRAIRILTAAVHSIIDDQMFLSTPEPEIRLSESKPYGQGYEVRYFILPANVSPNESKHLAGKAILEHLSRAGLSPSVPKEKVFLEKTDSHIQTETSLEDETSSIIEKSVLFSVLSENEMISLEKRGKKIELNAGDKLYDEGADEDFLYLVVEGLLKSFCVLEGSEEEKRIDHITAGMHIGEDCVMGRKSRASSVRAVSDAILFVYPGSLVREVANKNGKLLSLLNQNLRLSKEKIEKSKWTASKTEQKKMKGRQGVKKTIQTFFSDLFPDTNAPKAEPS